MIQCSSVNRPCLILIEVVSHVSCLMSRVSLLITHGLSWSGHPQQPLMSVSSADPLQESSLYQSFNVPLPDKHLTPFTQIDRSILRLDLPRIFHHPDINE
jgi:hypothetical protein